MRCFKPLGDCCRCHDGNIGSSWNNVCHLGVGSRILYGQSRLEPRSNFQPLPKQQHQLIMCGDNVVSPPRFPTLMPHLHPVNISPSSNVYIHLILEESFTASLGLVARAWTRGDRMTPSSPPLSFPIAFPILIYLSDALSLPLFIFLHSLLIPNRICFRSLPYRAAPDAFWRGPPNLISAEKLPGSRSTHDHSPAAARVDGRARWLYLAQP